MGEAVQDFTRIYDAYNEAVKTGDFEKVLPFLSTELREKVASADDRAELMMMAQFLVPQSYETLFLTMVEGGTTAELQVIVTVAVPEQGEEAQEQPATQRAEMILKFVKEGSDWKVDTPMILDNPDERARPKDLIMGSRGDYKDHGIMFLSGQIQRMEKQDAGTVLVIRAVDEEVAAFVPEALMSAAFVPGAIVELNGAGHNDDKLKFWAEEASLCER